MNRDSVVEAFKEEEKASLDAFKLGEMTFLANWPRALGAGAKLSSVKRAQKASSIREKLRSLLKLSWLWGNWAEDNLVTDLPPSWQRTDMDGGVQICSGKRRSKDSLTSHANALSAGSSVHLPKKGP